MENNQWKRTLDGRYHCTVAQCESAAEQESWPTLPAIQQHYNKVHAKPTELQFACDSCEIKFTSKNLLNYHRKIKHSSKFPCNQCGKEFPSQAVLERHTQIHLGKAGEQLDNECKPI